MSAVRWLAFGLLLAPVSAYVTSSALVPRAPVAAISLPTLPQLPANPLLDGFMRFRGVAVCWAGSLAGASLDPTDLMLALVSPEAYWLLREWRRQTYGQQEALTRQLEAARRDIRQLTDATGIGSLKGATVSVRTKGLWSTFHKATVRAKAVHDVLAVRVVLKGDAPEYDVHQALDAIRAFYPSVPGRFKDYVAQPKANGYAGLHDTLRLPDGRPFEIQIRSADMHREAEFGEASHRRYKVSPQAVVQRLLTGIADGAGKWPLQPQAALALATDLSQ